MDRIKRLNKESVLAGPSELPFLNLLLNATSDRATKIDSVTTDMPARQPDDPTQLCRVKKGSQSKSALSRILFFLLKLEQGRIELIYHLSLSRFSIFSSKILSFL